MAKAPADQNLQSLLEALRHAGEAPDTVSISDIQAQLGRRSFGPLLVAAGLPPMTPLGTIPGLPTTMAVVILLTAGQMLVGMRSIWLPKVILRQSINRESMDRIIELALPAARFVDRLLRPRLSFLTQDPYVYVVAGACCLLALTMPPLELIPMTGGIPAFPVVAFGLALIAQDGALVIVGAAAIGIALVGLALLAFAIF